MPAFSVPMGGRRLAGPVVIALLAAACSTGTTTYATGAPTAGPTVAPASSSIGASVSAAPSLAATSGDGYGYGGSRYGGGGASGSPASGAVIVSVATTSLGPVLTGANGLTLYTHAGDTATSSTCVGSCASAWPPLAVASGATVTAGTGVTGTFASLTRADGTIQVTYNGLPLYGWQSDTKPGDVTGQGVGGFSVAKP